VGFSAKPGCLINRCGGREVKALPRFIDKNAALALPAGANSRRNGRWPIFAYRRRNRALRQANGLAPTRGALVRRLGAASSKRLYYYPERAASGRTVFWPSGVVGGPRRKCAGAEIVATGGGQGRDITGTGLRKRHLAMAAAGVAISTTQG